MGCAESTSPPRWPPRRPGKVTDTAVEGFIMAMKSEYVQHKGSMVGAFFETSEGQQVEDVLAPVEDLFRKLYVDGFPIEHRRRGLNVLRDAWAPSVDPEGWPPRRPGKVTDTAVAGFIMALQSEYVDQKGPMVGEFFDTSEGQQGEDVLGPVDDLFRKLYVDGFSMTAEGRRHGLDVLREAWAVR